MRRAWLIAGFAASVAVLLAALVWILALARRLEAGEAEARRHAAREERVRLALWRMDSTLAAFLAFENAAPVDPPDGPRPPDPPWVGARFELAIGAAASAPPPVGEPAPDGLDAPRLLALLGPDVARSGLPAVVAEELTQMTANTIEFGQRQKVAQQSSNVYQIPRAGRQPPPSTPRPRGPTGVVRAFEPVWVDGRLLLVRRVVRDGAESLQGIAFEETALHEWLLGEVRDLLPAGDLRPVSAGEASDPGRRLALLPWRLEPGAVPLEIDAGGRPSVRFGLTLAAGAIVVVAATAGLLLLAGLRLARRRTEFASAVIHELRTPLTTFRVYTDLLAEEMVAPEERPGYLATLRHEAERLGHLVENVLAFARLERRRPPAAPRIALGPALHTAAERLARRAADADLELELTIEPEAEEVEVTIDPVALERILDNLCDNSCRYGRGDAGSRLELSAALVRRHAVVRWRDHGPGIARAARRRLFRPFERAGGGSAPAPAAGGIGLGLALSRRLARDSGGELQFVEPSGGGAAFELRLPVTGLGAAVSRTAAGSV